MTALPRRARRLLIAATLLVSAACQRGQPSTAPLPVLRPATPSIAAAAPAPAVTTPAPAAPRSLSDEVARTAAAVFGEAEPAAPRDSVGANEPVWDMDVRSYETHARVEHYVDLFAGSARDRFVARLARGTRYDGMIRAKMRASGMPEDLTFLALIESGYDPHAYSKAAAVGMWQFMSSTARDIGLRVDWWMDERRDPARSTDGAIRFLSFLQKQFGSLYLAAAAYNGGPGRVARGLTRFADELEGLSSEDRFFALADQDYLRAETKNYVPQIIAAALVAKLPAKYGLQFDSLPPYAYDSVDVAPGTSLGVVSQASGSSPAELKELNPALLRGVTPPDSRVWVRVPVGLAERTTAALDSLGAGAVVGWTLREVEGSSSTASAFAARHDVSLKQLRWFNPTMRTTKKGRLVAGQQLRVPREHALAFARELPDPSIERYGTSTGPSLASRGVHVVKRGETLGGIARRYGLSEARLRSMNGLRGSRLLAGQTLQVRSTARRASAAKVPAKKASAKKASAKKAPVKKASARKTSVKKAPAKKAATKKAPVKKASAKKTPAKSTKKPPAQQKR
jgi:membrane-bound lytic murein transglycosylase D